MAKSMALHRAFFHLRNSGWSCECDVTFILIVLRLLCVSGSDQQLIKFVASLFSFFTVMDSTHRTRAHKLFYVNG